MLFGPILEDISSFLFSIFHKKCRSRDNQRKERGAQDAPYVARYYACTIESANCLSPEARFTDNSVSAISASEVCVKIRSLAAEPNKIRFITLIITLDPL